MNKDKKLEEAIKIVKEIITHKEDFDYAYKVKIERPYLISHEQIQAIETVLQELENSIPKKKIEDKIKTFGEENEVITQEEYYARSYIRKFLKELLEEK